MSISFLIGFLKIEFVYCSFHGGRASTGFVHLAFCIAMRIARKLVSVSVHTSHFETQHQCDSVMAQWTIIIVNAGCVYWVHPKPFGMLGSLVDYFCCDTFGLLIVSKMKLYDESPALGQQHMWQVLIWLLLVAASHVPLGPILDWSPSRVSLSMCADWPNW